MILKQSFTDAYTSNTRNAFDAFEIRIYYTPFKVLCIVKIIDVYSGFLDTNHIRKIMIDHFHGSPVSVTDFIDSKSISKVVATT